MSVPPQVDVVEAQRLLTAGALLLDVREPQEVAVSSIAGARHIPMGEIPSRLDELPADQHILVLCHHGGRSARVTFFLRQNGLRLVSNIAGGIDAWALQVDPTLPRY